jgi:hypothetical protein
MFLMGFVPVNVFFLLPKLYIGEGAGKDKRFRRGILNTAPLADGNTERFERASNRYLKILTGGLHKGHKCQYIYSKKCH